MLPFIGPIITGLAGLFGGRRQKQEAFNEQLLDTTQSVLPQLSESQQLLNEVLTRTLLDRLFTKPDLSGYTAGGLSTINQAADARNKIISNIIASRGLSYSPTAAAMQTLAENARISDAANFLNQLPLLARSLGNEDIQNLISGINATPFGNITTGRSKSSQKDTQLLPSNMLGGLFSGLGQGLILRKLF